MTTARDATLPGRAPAPLLIMGSPRSGTTFLSHMVNRFFDLHVSRDNGTLLRYHANLARYEPLTDDRQLRRLINHMYRDHFFKTRLRDRGLKLDEAALFDRITTRTYGGVIEAILSAIAETNGKRQWAYKRASFARVAGRVVDELFPTARFVHIIRDARDVVLSMRNTPLVLLEHSWHFAAVDWRSHVLTGREIGQYLGPDRYLEVRYEDLMSDPTRMLVDILSFSGEGHDFTTRERRIRDELPGLIKPKNSEKWRRLMPPDALRLVERVAGPLLQELGYPVVNPDVAGAPVSRREMVWLQTDRLFRNLFTRNIGMMVRYRLEDLKGRQRARFSGPSTGRSAARE